MRAFDSAPHAFKRALLEPMLRFFDMRQGTGIRFAGIRTFLKTPQPIRNDFQQGFVRYPVDPITVRIDWTVLEADMRRYSHAALNIVGMMRATLPRLIDYLDFKNVVRRSYLVTIQRSHITHSVSGYSVIPSRRGQTSFCPGNAAHSGGSLEGTKSRLRIFLMDEFGMSNSLAM